VNTVLAGWFGWHDVIGRAYEVELLLSRLAEVAAGGGGAIWVEGEPGIGRSTLLDAVMSGAPSVGLRTFRATACGPMERRHLRTMATCLGVDVHADDGSDPEPSDRRSTQRGSVAAVDTASERLLAIVWREAARSAIALVIDDLQWADEGSVAMWHRLSTLVKQTPVLLVSACRPVPRRADVDRLRWAVTQSPTSVVMTLGALDSAEVNAMAASLLSAVPGPRVSAALGKAAGNPRYVREMIDGLVRGGLVVVADGVAELEAPAEQQLLSMREAISQRLDFLPDQTRAVLRTAAAVGQHVAMANLALVSDLAVPQLVPAVTDAIGAGVLADSGSELTFRHPLVREVLHDEIPAALRAGVHGHAAKVFAAAGASWILVARQLLAAPQNINGWVLQWLVDLPPAALYASPVIAADLLERARVAIPSTDPRRPALVTREIVALRLLHRQDELVPLGTEALREFADPELIGEVAWNLARGHGASGHFQQEESVITQTLLRPDLGLRWRGRLRAWHARGLLFGDHHEESRSEALLAISDGESCGDAVSVGWGLLSMGLGATDPADARALIERALDLVIGDDPESMDLRTRLEAELLMPNLCSFDQFEAALPSAEARATKAATTTHLVQIRLTAAERFYEVGKWNQAVGYLDQIHGLARPQHLLRSHGTAALIAARRGDSAAAQAHLASVADLPYTTGSRRLNAQRLIEAQALLWEASGDVAAAVRVLAEWLDLGPDPARLQLSRYVRPRVIPQLVRLALVVGDHAVADSAVAAARADATASQAPDPAVFVTLCQAMIDDDPGPMLSAAEYFEDAHALPTMAFALEEAAVRLAERNDLPGARAAFARAATVYEDMGALVDVRRVEARLRPKGVRRGPHSRHRRVGAGWEALTPAEIDVARQVMQGRSNSQIAADLSISPRTVEARVTQILAKLDVRNRRELAREAFRRDETRRTDASTAEPRSTAG
jgi:DNA-binding CsgD family transcriptional regulator